jgi:hypothetical protein
VTRQVAELVDRYAAKELRDLSWVTSDSFRKLQGVELQ